MTDEMLSPVSKTSDDSATLTIVERIATLEGRDPVTLPPLYDTIDPEALDSLVGSSTAGDSRSPTTIRFTYCGYDVRVRGDGEIGISSA